MKKAEKLKVALYGSNGHQLTHLLQEPHPLLDVVAVCGVPLPANPIRVPVACVTLEEILADPDVELVSLCSPSRGSQTDDSIRCLEAGKHILAEKPVALSEAGLDAILRAAEESGKCFREMGGTIFERPYWAMRQMILRGDLGEIVQVFAQKSYPYHPGRPQNEAQDGGLFLQVGIHAARLIEHTSGLKITSLTRIETGLGNPETGPLKMASAFQGELENGAIVSAICNYLNPRGIGRWGNDSLRVFGTKGMVEATGNGTRLVLGEHDLGAIPEVTPGEDYLTAYVRHILGHEVMPLSLDEELHPLRALLRAERHSVYTV